MASLNWVIFLTGILLGVFCNGNLPPATMATSGGSVTFHVHTDPYENLQGFKIKWECSNNTTQNIKLANNINNIKLYPNPTNAIVNLELEFSKEQPLSIKLIDMLGKTHLNTKTAYSQLTYKETLDLSNLTRGTYILYINNVPYKVTRN